MTPIRCFLMEQTNFYRLSLRRYASSYVVGKEVNPCPLPHGYHDASFLIAHQLESSFPPVTCDNDPSFPRSDARWPAHCPCGYWFTDDDKWQVNYESLWRRQDSGALMTIHEFPVGALWNADWMPSAYMRADGKYMMCRTPGGDWAIDSKCSNCTRPNEPHECWVRKGIPGTDSFDVGKDGNTCSAGAGSILIDNWHGFLRRGHLIQA